MNMRKPLIIEFTGPPNSGKTTLIHFLRDSLEKLGYHVEIKQEDSELVPKCIPKKTWIRNVWITYGQLQSLIETKFSTADIILVDRGFYDSMFWAEFLRIQNVCSNEDSLSLLGILDEMNRQFDLKPHHLFIIDVSTSVSLKRRYASANGEPITLSTDNFINLYKEVLEEFYKKVDVPTFKLDTSSLSLDVMEQVILDKLIEILKES